MATTEHINNIDKNFQDLLAGYLRTYSSEPVPERNSSHLDEDTLNAFAEGTLTQREMTPAVTHLADCGYCRNITAELVRLDLALADINVEYAVETAAEPAGLAETISSWFAKLFGATEAGVFAHGEPEGSEKHDENGTDEKDDTEEK